MGRKPKTESEAYDWFIEPLNIPTNQALAMLLPETDFHAEQKDTAGHEHNLWQCRLDLIKNFVNSKIGYPELNFKTFSRHRLNGNLNEFSLKSQNSPSKKASKELINVLKKLTDSKIKPVV